MVPPPIRTKFDINANVSNVSSTGRSAQGWLGSLLGLGSKTGKSTGKSVGHAVVAEAGADDDLVCLSPLSQFFCNVSNPPDIYANMTLQGHCKLEELVPPMQHMADLHDRFRRRLVFSFGVWKAEVLDNFDVRTLMREVTLDGPDPQQAYHQHMGKLMSEEPLGTNGLPPWDVLCIHYTSDPKRTDVLLRASHVIGDGQLFMKLIKQIMEPLDPAAHADFNASITNARAGTPGVGKRSRRHFAPSVDGGSSVSSCVAGSLSSSSGGGSAGGEAAADSHKQQQQGHAGRQGDSNKQAQGTLRQQQQGKAELQQQQSVQPSKLLQQRQQHMHRQQQQGLQHWWGVFVRLLQWCWDQYTALVFSCIMLFWFADPVNVIKASEQQCNGRRRWSSVTLSLADFHATAKASGHTLNTLAVTCLAGGVRRYLLRHGQQPSRRIRMCGMVDTRSMPGLLPGSMHSASNNFSFIGVPLYTGEIDPLERLDRAGRAMSWVRHSVVVPIAIRVPSIIQTIFQHPEASSKAIKRALPFKTTVGFSNMKGPAGSWSLSGYRVTNIHNGVQPMAFGSFISLFSYDNSITFTHSCFETKTKTPEVLLECMVEEYHCLRKAASIGRAADAALDSPRSSTDTKIKAG